VSGAFSRIWMLRQPARASWLEISSAGAIYAIGDVHGRCDLAQAMEARLLDDLDRHGPSEAVFLYLGDLIDRGPKSAHLLDHVLARPPAGIRRVILRGNHEDMFLSFLERPDANSAWLDHGGDATLASYGVYLTATDVRRVGRGYVTQMMTACIPDNHISALREAPRGAVAGDWVFTHAGLEPELPRTRQSAAGVSWGIAGDLTERDDDAGRVVFGHFAGDRVRRRQDTFCIDTGAYATGRLSALRVVPSAQDGAVELFEVCGSKGIT
jgi:serine/threonine protein phosphatase 1